MPSSHDAELRWLDVPYSECAMHVGVAGERHLAEEEDLYPSGETIPPEQRRGCYVHQAKLSEDGKSKYIVKHPMLKAEAGWID
jgi:hypothetical protein